jgi:hypothetical protein
MGATKVVTDETFEAEVLRSSKPGGMLGTLDGDEVDVATGDMVWTGVDATRGFINRRDESATWLETQSPVPPDSGAFFFPGDWRALSR